VSFVAYWGVCACIVLHCVVGNSVFCVSSEEGKSFRSRLGKGGMDRNEM
jgi:hypothetical protein